MDKFYTSVLFFLLLVSARIRKSVQDGIGRPFNQAIRDAVGEEKTNLLTTERDMREQLERVKAKMYIEALNDECIPIVCVVDKFSIVNHLHIEEATSTSMKREIGNHIKTHLRMAHGADVQLVTMMSDVLKALLSRGTGIYEQQYKHVIYANKSFIRFDYYFYLKILADGRAALSFYGQVGLMEVAKARVPVLIYELTRAMEHKHLEEAGKELQILGNLKMSSMQDAAQFLIKQAERESFPPKHADEHQAHQTKTPAVEENE